MPAWVYPQCTMVGHHDGDTIWTDQDFGQEIYVKARRVRLFGIACNELSKPGGQEASDAITTKVPIGTSLYLVSHGWDKYSGRIDALVYIGADRAATLNQWLVDEGWAVPWDGNHKQPIVPFPRVIPARHTEIAWGGSNV